MEYRGQTIEELAIKNPIVNKVLTMFYQGHIETYQDALEMMVFILAEINDGLGNDLANRAPVFQMIVDKDMAERFIVSVKK